jgi:hypothetical protein
VVWSQAPRTADPGPLLDLVGGPRRPLVVAAAGPGWSHRDLPTEITALDSLEGALQVVLAATDAARVRT